MTRASDLRPLYFTVVFWGDTHRRHFTDLLLASLLAPRNVPALDPRRGSKVLIATTRADWDALQEHPLFTRLRGYVEPVWCRLDPPQPSESAMQVMSRGQALMAIRSFEDRAYGMYLAPDTIFSDGSIAALERMAASGKKIVLAAAIRFQYECAIPELERQGFLRPGRPTVIGARDLMRILLHHLHSETRRYEYESPWLAESPISPYWQVPEGDGLLIHSFSWAPLLVDYGALAHHDTKTFEKWTLDGDYIYRNFPDPADIHVITDSDEVAYVSFTKESELHFELQPYLAKKPRWIQTWYKDRLIRRLKDSWVMDPLKRRIFPTPVYFHASEITDVWAQTRRKAGRVIARAYEPPSRRDRLIEVGVALLAPELFLPFASGGRLAFVLWCWRYRRFVWRRILEKTGVVRGHSRVDDGRDWVTPTFGLPNPIWSVRVVVPWYWRYRRFLWQRTKEKLGLARGHSRWDEGDWTAPARGLLNPIWSIRGIWGRRPSVLHANREAGRGGARVPPVGKP